MSKRPAKERQTLDHRSPECFWHGKKPDQAIDMWSTAVVVSYMCGHPFCEVEGGCDIDLVRRWVSQLGAPRSDAFTGYPAWEKDRNLLERYGPSAPVPAEAAPWPSCMAIAVGNSGMRLVSSLFSFTPHERPSASEVLEHSFMTVCSFPLMGVCPEEWEKSQGLRPAIVLDNSEGLGRLGDPFLRSFYPITHGLVGQTLLAGERHTYGIRYKDVARETLSYILADDVFVGGTAANLLLVDLAHGREVATGKNPVRQCVIDGPKTRIAGHMGTFGGVSMIGISTKQPCIIARVRDWRAALLEANLPGLLAMQAKCKGRVSRIGKFRGRNGDHFLSAALEDWFLGRCEVTLTEARGCDGNYLVERHHMDGSMSLFHGGLTLGGNRDLFLNVEGFGRVRVPNSPGTFYLGNLTGPRHQVYHQRCSDHDLVDVPGIGRRSITIMLRTGLFPHDRSRFMDQLPKPKCLWACMKNCMVEYFQTVAFRLPTLEEVKRQTQLRQHGGECKESSSKKRRITGKTNNAFGAS